MLLFTVGFFNVIDGLRAWGWVALILGVLQVFAAIGVLAGNQAARWVGVAVIGLNAIGQMFFMRRQPPRALGGAGTGGRIHPLMGDDTLGAIDSGTAIALSILH
jgi:hypothetical protein